jgi:hypothetical protein
MYVIIIELSSSRSPISSPLVGRSVPPVDTGIEGRSVGFFVGVFDGSTGSPIEVGVVVGVDDGLFVGFVLGDKLLVDADVASEGAAVGELVGALVGALVGLAVDGRAVLSFAGTQVAKVLATSLPGVEIAALVQLSPYLHAPLARTRVFWSVVCTAIDL